MSVKAEYVDGIFRPLEAVPNAEPGKVYSVFSEEELRGLTKERAWLGAANPAIPGAAKPSSESHSPEQFAAFLDGLAAFSDAIPPMPHETFSREMIYQSHA